MRILANRRIKRLLCAIAGTIAIVYAVCAAAVSLRWPGAALYILVSAVGMGILILAELYFYFAAQEKTMEEAVAQIRSYISGNLTARIDCDEEGELYRLFHEVNSLAATLNAHAENERQAKVFLRDTLSNISHQLKTPLAALNIYNGILKEDSTDASTIQTFTSLSEKELDRIETLVQSLLKIAKLDSGTLVMEKASENLSEIMDCIERRFAYQAEQEEKKLLFCGDDVLMLPCDRGWLTEAIGNLVKNALDHTQAGATIRIEWRALASVAQIIVKDDGSGIHPEDLPHIFKRFYRSRFSKDTQGVGLGLPLAKAIIQAHSGTIEVESDWGKGTVFTVNLLIPTKM